MCKIPDLVISIELVQLYLCNIECLSYCSPNDAIQTMLWSLGSPKKSEKWHLPRIRTTLQDCSIQSRQY